MKFIMANVFYVVLSFFFGVGLSFYRVSAYRTIMLDKLMVACICVFLLSSIYWYCNQVEKSGSEKESQ
jgi:hypothetical protein